MARVWKRDADRISVDNCSLLVAACARYTVGVWRCGLVLLIACGRLNFEPAGTTDASGGDGPATDGLGIDAPDGPLAAPAAMVGDKTAVVDGGGVTYAVTVPALQRGALVVTVQIGSNCAPADPGVPFVENVTFAGVGMTQIKQLVGTPCGPTLTRSELWLLTGPPAVTGEVVVDLSGDGDTVHSAAIVIEGIDQTTPVRAVGFETGDAAAGAAQVDAVPGDLVLSFAGQGDFIDSTDAGFTELFRFNIDAQNTLNNTAASFKIATDPVEVAGWTFEDPDDFQIIALSLRP